MSFHLLWIPRLILPDQTQHDYMAVQLLPGRCLYLAITCVMLFCNGENVQVYHLPVNIKVTDGDQLHASLWAW